MPLSYEMSGQLKSALLDCEVKSEQLEEAARQLTLQKLRCQLAIETRLISLSKQMKAAGNKLLAELGCHHDSWQVKIHKQEHMVLKHSMQLSSALAKEIISPALIIKLEDRLTVDLAGLYENQFRHSPKLDTIVKSDIGFLQFGPDLPSHWLLSLHWQDQYKVTCLLSTKRTMLAGSSRQFMEVVVQRCLEESEVIDVEYQMMEDEDGREFRVSFVPEGGCKFRVTASMYGEMVRGSPMFVEVREEGKGNLVVEDFKEDVKISTVEVEAKEEFETDRLVENTVLKYITDEGYNGDKLDSVQSLQVEDIGLREAQVVVQEEVELSVTVSSDGDMEIMRDLPKLKISDVFVTLTTDPVDLMVQDNQQDEVSITVESPVPKSPVQDDTVKLQGTSFPSGTMCLALWSEDSVWYRARVDSVKEDLYQVTFRDYGNSVTVDKEHMVESIKDIPKDQHEMVDHKVWENESFSSKWSDGMRCIARWSADFTWFNGVVTDVSGGQCTVLFTDYGNEEVVLEESMVEYAKDIPAGESVDVFVIKEDLSEIIKVEVECTDDRKEIADVGVTNKIVDISDGGVTPQELSQDHIISVQKTDESSDTDDYTIMSTDPVEKASKRTDLADPSSSTDLADGTTFMSDPADNFTSESSAVGITVVADRDDPKFEVGSYCIAEWTKDSTWYNGLIIEINPDMSYMVEFVDYGNVEVVAQDKIVDLVGDVPPGSSIDQWATVKVDLVTEENVVKEETPICHKLEVAEENVIMGETPLCPELEERVNKEDYITEDIFPKELAVSTTPSPSKSPSKISPVVPRPLNTDPSFPGSQKVANTLAQSQPSSQAEKTVSLSETIFVPGCPDEATGNQMAAGQVCLARWPVDKVWYNARVEEVLPCGQIVVVTFTDYGNTDQLPIGRLLQCQDSIPLGEVMDVNVQQKGAEGHPEDVAGLTSVGGQESFSVKGLVEGDKCVALWPVDNVWYNARILKFDMSSWVGQVEFCDYGNIDMVSLDNMHRTLVSVQEHRPGEEITVDPHVETGNSGEADSLSLMILVSKDQHGKRVLPAVVVDTIPVGDGRVGMTIMQDGSLVLAMEVENMVKIWSREGKLKVEVEGGRQFYQPVDVVNLGPEGFAVKDKHGIMVFNSHGMFLKELVVDKLDTFSGLTVDCMGRIVTINRCLEGDQGMLTEKGETDILYVDVEKEKVVKRVEMVDIIADRAKTDCRSLTMYRDKLYVVDSGLDCIYTLFHEDGEDQAEVFGMPGRQEAQFSGISSVVVDDEGCMIVSDTRNNRLQLIDDEWAFIGFVKVVPRPLSKPSMMCLDRQMGQLVVHNMGNREVVIYQLGVKD